MNLRNRTIKNFNLNLNLKPQLMFAFQEPSLKKRTAIYSSELKAFEKELV